MVTANARPMRPTIIVSADEYEEAVLEAKRDYGNARYARLKAKREAKRAYARAYALARYYRLKAEREAERAIEEAERDKKRAYGRARYYRLRDMKHSA